MNKLEIGSKHVNLFLFEKCKNERLAAESMQKDLQQPMTPTKSINLLPSNDAQDIIRQYASPNVKDLESRASGNF